MALKDEIFKLGITLYQALDRNDITSGAANQLRLDHLEIDVLANKQQLDSLGQTLKKYQDDTEAKLIKLEDLIVKQQVIIDQMVKDFESLSKLVETFDARISSLEKGDTKTKEDIKALQSATDEIKTQLEVLYPLRYMWGGSRFRIARSDLAKVEFSSGQIDGSSTMPVNFVRFYNFVNPVVINGKTYYGVSFRGLGTFSSLPGPTDFSQVGFGYQTGVFTLNRGDFRNNETLKILVIPP